MADVFSVKKRSEVMASIRSRGNKATELRLIVIFRGCGIAGWRRRRPVFGKPDFIFPRRRVAVFVDGCFWHGCPRHSTVPATRRAFWLAKFARNQARDRCVTRALRKNGWRVVRIWEHELRSPNRVAARVRKALSAGSPAQRRGAGGVLIQPGKKGGIHHEGAKFTENPGGGH